MPSAAKRRWRRPPIVQASYVLHAAALVAVVLRPQAWPWILAAIMADHLLLTAIGLWPRSQLLGPNWIRLPRSGATERAVAITIDDGPDPTVTPRVLDLLDQHQAKVTFFCVGERVREHAQMAREIVARGHRIENHSERHLHRFSLLGPRGMSDEIERAQQTIVSIVGEAPHFFRAPAGLRNPFLDPVLTRLGLHLASWTRRGFDTVNTDPGTVLAKLTRDLQAGDILLLHDGHAARTPSGTPVILEVLPQLLQRIRQAGLRPITLREALPAASAGILK